MEFQFDAEAPPVAASFYQASPELEAFRLRVQQDGEQQARLAAVPASEFKAEIVRTAASFGLGITAAEVDAAMNATRAGWFERGLR